MTQEQSPILAYIEAQPEQLRPLLNSVYELLKDCLPHAQERISWGMPTFWQQHNLIHFAPAKHHLGIYPGPAAIEYFADEFRTRGLRFSKGALQLPYAVPLPMDLIKAIALWCLEH